MLCTASQTTGARLRRIAAATLAAIIAIAIVGAFAPFDALARPLSEVQAEAAAAKEKMDAANKEAEAAANKYYEALDAYDAAAAAMKEAEELVAQYTEELNTTQERLGDRAASMYRNGSISFIDVLLGADSFSDFVTTWEILNDQNDQDAADIEASKELQAQAEAARKEQASQEIEAAKQLKAAEAAKAELEAKAAEYKSAYDSLSAEAAKIIEEQRAAELARQNAARANASHNELMGGYSAPVSSGTASGKSYSSMAEYALSKVGCWYVWGGTGPNTFDCSGLVYWSYRQAYGHAPAFGRTTYSMYNYAKNHGYITTDMSQASYGDLLISADIGHVGISLGGNSYVHAPTTGAQVCVRNNASYAFKYVLKF